MTFEKRTDVIGADTLNIGGYVLRSGAGHIANVYVDWQNKGAFTTEAWHSTNLARMIGWECAIDMYAVAAENRADGNNGYIEIVGDSICWRTRFRDNPAANTWHKASIVFPVNPV